MILGIGGLIGAGKSTLCRALVTLGAVHYDADARAKKLMAEHEILPDAGIFLDPVAYENRTKQVWPLVLRDAEKWLQERPAGVFLIESAVLQASGLAALCGDVIEVRAPLSARQERLSGVFTKSEMAAREAFQPAISSPDLVIINDGQTPILALAEAIWAWSKTRI